MNKVLIEAMKLSIDALGISQSDIKAQSCVGGFSLCVKKNIIGLVSNDVFYIAYHSEDSELFKNSKRLFNNNSLLFEVSLADPKAKDMIVAAYNSGRNLQNAKTDSIELCNLKFIDDELRHFLKELNIKTVNDVKHLGSIAIYHAIKNKKGYFTTLEHLYALDNISQDEFSSFISKERQEKLSLLALR